MNQKSTIDSLFKNQLQQMEQPGADAGWQRLEPRLLEQNKKRRRGAAWLLGLLLLLVGSGALVWALREPQQAGKGTVARAVAADGQRTAVATGTGTVDATGPTVGTQAAPVADNATNGADTRTNRPYAQPGRQRTRITGGDAGSAETAGNGPVANPLATAARQKTTVRPAAAETMPETEEGETVALAVPIAPVQENPAAEPNKETTKEDKKETLAKDQTAATDTKDKPNNEPEPAKKKDAKKSKKRPLQLELAGGIDLSNGLRNPGHYGALLLRVPLNNKASLLAGAGIATNKMTESYKQADKQNTLNRDVDATLQGLRMLQFPVLYEQAIKEQKLLFRAGLVPIYILDANVVNVPNSFSGNPSNFRTFTLNDINRFNVLFSAGLHLRATPRLGVELKANYGLTELVKNSYINQSGENNNFKSAQVGLLLMIGKKRK
jgi:hypothetical protein